MHGLHITAAATNDAAADAAAAANADVMPAQ